MKLRSDKTLIAISIVAIIGIILATFFAIQAQMKDRQVDSMMQERQDLLSKLDRQNTELSAASTTISELTEDLEDLRDDLEDLADDYKDERNRNEEFEDQIRDLAGNLSDLDKLAKIDKELLQKYSKVYFLNENYVPSRLEKIEEDYILTGRKDQYFHGKAMEHLEDMMEAAEDEGLDLKIVSAYRSFDEQTEVKGHHTQVYGSGANTFSADQGYSEHQLGTTVDLTNPTVGGAYNSFAQTEEYQWLLDNAHKYGFILSYPENNDFYIFEPWHWRFVSTDLARDLDRKNETFYEMEQREIDQYLLEFFD